MRERAHHVLEESLQEALLSGDLSAVRGVATVERLLRVCEAQGLPADGDDLRWVATMLDWAKSGPHQQPTKEFTEEDVELVRHLIQDRRSVRFWDGRPVPRAMLEEMVRAGLWAPCACNLQTLRVLIVEEPGGADAKLFEGEVSGAPAYLLVCQDRRAYEFYRTSVPQHNRGLDCGAAMQNMLLMAHALGLGAVWLTFEGGQLEAIRERYRIPEHVDIISYIAVGWPTVYPLPPGRMEVEAVLLDADT
jgi:nitroreductase